MTRIRTGATAERLALAERARALRREGRIYNEIAAELGISRSYASMLLTDPDGAKARARKDSYAGRCLDCGNSTSGSDGREQAASYCDPCWRKRVHANRRWTRETVIDAIQRFAAVHGRPPVADEWIRADPEHGYPPRSSVYMADGHHYGRPFESWAAAIEAAGFPRPTNRRRTAMPREGYVVLHETEPGVWQEIGSHIASSQIVALNQALDGHEPSGRWVAVPGRHFAPRTLEPKTIYEFVAEE